VRHEPNAHGAKRHTEQQRGVWSGGHSAQRRAVARTGGLAAERGRAARSNRNLDDQPSLVGPDGTILWANQAELDLLGYTRETYVGRNITEFHADQSVINDILACLSRGEMLRDYPARLRHRDGSIRHVLIDSSVLFENGKFVHTRCFTRDVTAMETQ
jgi:PAS domain S-box-containing protein